MQQPICPHRRASSPGSCKRRGFAVACLSQTTILSYSQRNPFLLVKQPAVLHLRLIALSRRVVHPTPGALQQGLLLTLLTEMGPSPVINTAPPSLGWTSAADVPDECWQQQALASFSPAPLPPRIGRGPQGASSLPLCPAPAPSPRRPLPHIRPLSRASPSGTSYPPGGPSGRTPQEPLWELSSM